MVNLKTEETAILINDLDRARCGSEDEQEQTVGPSEHDQAEVCDFCGGSGEIATDESDGEGHIMRGVGTQKCICRLSVTEYDADEL